jgi:polyhydroxyalkanoate synthesis repressor PhaR
MVRSIKKYANRRLYDTQSSCYITLDDLKELIVSGISIEVQDAKTRKDISREVLLQLVAEQESLGRPILNEAILTALIRFYDHPMQKLASNYLETALGQLQNQRAKLSEQLQGLLESPADLVSQLTRQNTEWLIQLQKSFMSALSPAEMPEPGHQDKKNR